MCIALCTIVAHNIAQNRPDSFPPYPPDDHHSSDDVYLREGGGSSQRHRKYYLTVLTSTTVYSLILSLQPEERASQRTRVATAKMTSSIRHTDVRSSLADSAARAHTTVKTDLTIADSGPEVVRHAHDVTVQTLECACAITGRRSSTTRLTAVRRGRPPAQKYDTTMRPVTNAVVPPPRQN